MRSGPASGRGIARLLAVCAVLFGLFLMHGAPASAAEGCHGSMTAPAPMATGHDASPMAHVLATHRPGPTVQAAEGMAMHGALCVSTPAQERISLPAPGLMAVAAITLLIAWVLARLRAGSGSRRRGPPTGGRDHLLRVCIART
ncbi:hypothetical protein [Streptomyces sp. CBMA152]|uniref:hypothetical protein n=1 Tax=Streptomyces sp. CBMA152 TaxID=1896312 RepID=UPI001660D0C8|nr:hypothetical protein [Streptomyces sp. CBMA152]MBD0742602.1 hypothetical protein [Streptomyces sp. CBMA152]